MKAKYSKATGLPIHTLEIAGESESRENSSICYTADSFLVDVNGEPCANRGLLLSPNQSIRKDTPFVYIRGTYVPGSLVSDEGLAEKIQEAHITARLFHTDTIDGHEATVIMDATSLASFINCVPATRKDGDTMQAHHMSNQQAFKNNVKLFDMRHLIDVSEYIKLFHHLPPYFFFFSPLHDLMSNNTPLELNFDYGFETKKVDADKERNAEEKEDETYVE